MKPPSPDQPIFEEALVELEKIVRELEDGKINLDQALSSYERGVGLLKHCYGKLQAAELKIQTLMGVDKDGNPVTESFEHAASLTKGN